MTVALQIRDVDETTHDLLAREAERCHQSLQGFLLDLVTREAQIQINRTTFNQLVEQRIQLADDWSPAAVIRQGREAGFEADQTNLP
ncbi:MAG: hypothetical protein LBV30_05340 [Propionibacteriaceae bacterium]|jgi:uncharacterized protein (DUF1778 family)|nr:hypothetical protein [Propionibacteriaceae bacterium]